MARLGTHQAPATYAREQAPARCCAKCRRGMPGMGASCAVPWCRCHDQEDQIKEMKT